MIYLYTDELLVEDCKLINQSRVQINNCGLRLLYQSSGISKFQLSVSEIIPIIIVDHNSRPVSHRDKLFSLVING